MLHPWKRTCTRSQGQEPTSTCVDSCGQIWRPVPSLHIVAFPCTSGKSHVVVDNLCEKNCKPWPGRPGKPKSNWKPAQRAFLNYNCRVWLTMADWALCWLHSKFCQAWGGHSKWSEVKMHSESHHPCWWSIWHINYCDTTSACLCHLPKFEKQPTVLPCAIGRLGDSHLGTSCLRIGIDLNASLNMET